MERDTFLADLKKYGNDLTDKIEGNFDLKIEEVRLDFKTLQDKFAREQRLSAVDEKPDAMGFDGFSDFIRGIVGTEKHRYNGSGERDDRFFDDTYTKLQESVGAEGGFLVPPEFRAQLMSRSLGQAVIRSRAMVIPMASSSIKIPTVLETSRATTVFGGVQAFWEGEGTAFTASEPKFGELELIARKLTGLTRVNNELMTDTAITLGPLLEGMFGSALAFFEDNAFIEGSGAGQPLGILNSGNAALLAVLKETGQAANTIVYENLTNIFSRMLPESMGRAIWLAHQDTIPELFELTRPSEGTTNTPAVMVGGIEGAPVFMIFGRPVIFTEHMQTVGNQGDIAFVDPMHYVIGDRQDLVIATSIHEAFTSDKTTWRFTERVDGRPWLTSPVTPKNGSTTISPFVTLAVRA